MTGRWLLAALMICALGAGWMRGPATDGPKRVIGQTAEVEIAEAGVHFIGRVDTGAASTSVHAEAVRIEGESVRFVLFNRNGERVPMRMPLAKKRRVRNTSQIEERVYVEFTLRHDGESKRVLTNLNDRAGLTYGLLLGRNWLEDDFLVDVSHGAVSPDAGPREGAGLVSR